jgi:hypothetical protein
MEELFAKVRVMVCNATFNNISIIYPEKTIGLPQVTDKPYHEHDTNTNLEEAGIPEENHRPWAINW